MNMADLSTRGHAELPYSTAPGQRWELQLEQYLLYCYVLVHLWFLGFSLALNHARSPRCLP